MILPISRLRAVAFGAAALLSLGAVAMHLPGEGRKTTTRDLTVDAQRVVLPNGLTLILAPDPRATAVTVWMTFRAGTVYEPPGRSGIAHLVEHVFASGPTPDTDYATMLETRRARYFNASTSYDTLQFESTVPAAELPLALWVMADRLGTIPTLIDDALVERHRRVVLQERALRAVDVPYAAANARLVSRLFSAPHPMHGNTIGIPAELSRVSAQDVKDFAARLLVPANATLTLVGRFEPAEAQRLAGEGVGRLASGFKATPPGVPMLERGVVEALKEPVSREPRVAMAWRFSGVPQDEAAALRLGAQLLSILVDGAFGMRLHADFEETELESMFELEVVLPWDETQAAVQDDADAFLRQLTLREMDFDLFRMANVALDRAALFDLDTLEGRAGRLARVEQLYRGRVSASTDAEAHWALDPGLLRDVARTYLRSPHVVVHARPLHPRPARGGGR